MTTEGHAIAMNKPLRNVHTDNGGATVDRGWLLHREMPACTADACSQGRRQCPAPDACHLPVEMYEPSLLASRAFWILGFLCIALWSAVCWIAFHP